MWTEFILTALLGFPLLLAIFARLLAASRKGSTSKWQDIDPQILKVGGSIKRLEAVADDTDVVVIGSGISGLAAASVLAKGGYKVVVLEQHDVAGGASHTFEEGGYEFDVGIHYTGGQLDSWLSPLRRLWSVVSDGALAWSPCADDYDVCYNVSTSERVDVNKDHAKSAERFLAKIAPDVPGARAALNKYKRACMWGRVVFAATFGLKVLPSWCLRILWPSVIGPLWRRFAGPPVTDVMHDCGFNQSPELQRLGGALLYLYGDYGQRPARAPWFLQAALDSHYEGGAFMPLGGSSSVAKTLVATIVRHGGSVFVRAPVSEILLDQSGRAEGVRSRGVDVKAKVAVISTAGFRNTFGSSDLAVDRAADVVAGRKRVLGRATRQPLVPEPMAAQQRSLLQRSKNSTTLADGKEAPEEEQEDTVGGSIAMIYLFVGLNKSDEELGLSGQNVWRLKDFDHDAAFAAFEAMNATSSSNNGSATNGDIASSNESGASPPSIPALEDLPACFVGMASAKDRDWPRRHPGKACVTVLAPVPYSWFAPWQNSSVKHRGAAYEAYKSQWKDLLLAALYEHWPQCRGCVEVAEVGTPLSHNFYLGTVRGEVYGLDANVARFASLEAHLATHPGPCAYVPGLYQAGQDALCVGVPSALLSGVFAAARISPLAGGRAVLEALVS